MTRAMVRGPMRSQKHCFGKKETRILVFLMPQRRRISYLTLVAIELDYSSSRKARTLLVSAESTDIGLASSLGNKANQQIKPLPLARARSAPPASLSL